MIILSLTAVDGRPALFRAHAGTWSDADILLEIDKFDSPCLPSGKRKKTTDGRLSGNQASLFEISNAQVRFSAIKKAADSGTFIVQVYKPKEQVQKTDVLFGKSSIEGVRVCNLNKKGRVSFHTTKTHTRT